MSSSGTDLVRSATSYNVSLGGTTFQQTSNDGLQRLVIEDSQDSCDMLTLTVGGAESQPSWNFEIGGKVEAKVGAGASNIFTGEITALEPGFQVEGISSMTIRCMDNAHRLGRGRKTRFWENMKDSDVASEVGSECGLSVDADATEETHPYILQRNESNIAFLKRLAARNNFLCTVRDGKLQFKKATFSGTTTDVKMGESLRSVRMSYNTSDMVQKVIVRGWDIKKKQEIVGQATTGDITKIGGGQLGADVAAAFGDATAYITDVPVSSQAMANAIAKAEIERIARQFCHGTGSIQGNDAVRAGSMVNFSGLASKQDGKYYIVSSRHVISNRSGYTTEFTFCSNTYGS